MRFALRERFADADDGRESGFERGFHLAVHGFVGFAEILAALGVADDHGFGSRHRRSCAWKFRR